MRTTIAIDDALLREALRLAGAKTPSEVVELALRTLVRLEEQAKIRKFRGKLEWNGDLDIIGSEG